MIELNNISKKIWGSNRTGWIFLYIWRERYYLPVRCVRIGKKHAA